MFYGLTFWEWWKLLAPVFSIVAIILSIWAIAETSPTRRRR